MKHFGRSQRSASFPLALAFLSLAACAGGDDDAVEREAGEQPEFERPAGAAAVQTGPADTIEISFEGGAIVVKPDSLPVERNQRVHWRAATDSTAAWIVAFSAVNTPLADSSGNQKVFLLNGPTQGSTPAKTTARVSGSAPQSVFKYTVFWPDTSNLGSYIMLDPKLVIEDAPPDTVAAEPSGP